MQANAFTMQVEAFTMQANTFIMQVNALLMLTFFKFAQFKNFTLLLVFLLQWVH